MVKKKDIKLDTKVILELLLIIGIVIGIICFFMIIDSTVSGSAGSLIFTSIVILGIYFIPSIIAKEKKKLDIKAIFVLNLLKIKGENLLV